MIFEDFFSMLEDQEDPSRAYEAPIDVAQEAQDETEAMNEEAEDNGEETDNTGELDDDPNNIPGVNIDEEEATEDEDTGTEEEADTTEEEETADETVEDEEPVEEEPEEEPIDQERDYDKRKKVHSNTLHLLQVIKSSRDSFEQKYNKVLSVNQIKDYHLIIKNFNDLIDMTENILSTKFIDGKYDNLIKYYVSLYKVYDIISRMVGNFVKEYEEVNKN